MGYTEAKRRGDRSGRRAAAVEAMKASAWICWIFRLFCASKRN